MPQLQSIDHHLQQSGDFDNLQVTKELPHSSEVEQALIGLLMLNNEYFDEVEGELLPEHFYVKFNGAVFASISQLLGKGFEASPMTIRENMKSTFDGDGDLANHLSKILENASNAFHVRDLSGIIKNYYLQRRLIEVGQNLAHDAQDIPASEQSDRISDMISNVEQTLFTLVENGSTVTYQDLKNPLKNVIDQIAEAKKNQGQLVGVTSGLKDIDEALGGFHKDELIILAARPSMGKTAISINFAQNAAAAIKNNQFGGAAVGVFSMEMSAEQLTSRIISAEARVNSHKITDGSLDDEEFTRIQACANTLAEMPIIIDDTPALPIAAFRSRARRMKRQYDIGMIVVDYLQLMRGSSKSSQQNRVQEISEISQGLKAVARELSIPVIALSQLSRAVESRDNKRPMLSDLRESGSIEQDADVVMFLYREDYYFEKTLPPEVDRTEEQRSHLQRIKGKAECIISKNRKGPTTTVALSFLPQYTLFKDYVPAVAIDQYGSANADANSGAFVPNTGAPMPQTSAPASDVDEPPFS
ncbi:MAG: replicative DNA helicase [Magnetococcales bacterium]|nr:replicative DNA helicase [Magnetococcales bacterium]|tara:strand:- start:1981 stop:3570 length:1590 start_codon:yes stop_codon:yes gene_type:complete